MLSVLIPIYNRNVNNLVKELDKQLMEREIPYEILLCDDCSEASFQSKNATLQNIDAVVYIQNEQNAGRAKVRNFLAQSAQYPYLLFIDCDATVFTHNYIRNYVETIKKNEKKEHFIINGGIAYRKEKPEQERYLRWFYGKQREEIPAEKRGLNPYHLFTPFNVVLTKSIFSILKFDESLTTYGNEDTLLGCQFKQKNIPYFHIDNPLYHDGLDKNEDFLSKIRISIDNLFLLSKKEDHQDIINESRLLKTYTKCKKMALRPVLATIFQHFQSKIEKRLCSNPNLFLLDIYKLTYLATKES